MGENSYRNIIAIGIENEFEGDSTLWFDIAYAQLFRKYLYENFDIKNGKPMNIIVKAFNQKEWAEIEGNS